MVRNGVEKKSYSIEQAFTDINQFFIFRGQRLSSMSLEVSAGAIATGSFSFMGSETARAGTTFATAITPATTSPVVNGTSNVGSIIEDGVTLSTALQSISINVDNGLRNQQAVSHKFPAGIGYGRQTVSGSLTAYFETAQLYDKFLNHETTSLSFDFADADGNRLRITLPKVYFSSDSPAPTGIDQDVMESIEFTAVFDATTNCQIQLDYIAG